MSKSTNGKVKNNYIETSNISIGEVFKNYKELCYALEETPRTGTNSKNSHIKNIELYLSFKLDGRKYTILDIYEEPKNPLDNRSEGNNALPYIDDIELLLLNMLRNKDDSESLLLSKNRVLKELGIVNMNYFTAKYKQGRLSNDIDISLNEIQDFYQSSDSLLYRNIETALNRLKSKSLIVLEETMTVAHAKTVGALNKNSELKAIKGIMTDEYGDESIDITSQEVLSFIDHRRATKKEKDAILLTQQKYLDLGGYETIRDAFLEGKMKKFYDDVTNDLFDKYNIYMYYMSFEITFNNDLIQNYMDELANEVNYNITKDSVNKDIMARLEDNANNRNQKALEDESNEVRKNRKIAMRASLNYLSNHRELVETLIDNSTHEYKL